MRIIPHGIDVDYWEPIDQAQARRRIKMHAERFHIICISRFHPAKGVHILLEAIQLLAPSIPELYVTIIGNISPGLNHESHEKSLKAMTLNLPVTFEGFVSNGTERYKQLLAASDVSVIPAIRDNQPTTTMESLSIGVPVVGSRVGAIPDMITVTSGRTFKKGDAGDLKNTLLALYQNRTSLLDMKLAARNHALQNFSWRTAAEKNIAAFQTAM